MHEQVTSNLESLDALSKKIQLLAEESAARFQHKIHQYTDQASEQGRLRRSADSVRNHTSDALQVLLSHSTRILFCFISFC